MKKRTNGTNDDNDIEVCVMNVLFILMLLFPGRMLKTSCPDWYFEVFNLHEYDHALTIK